MTTALDNPRLPPQDLDAEQMLLGAILLNNETLSAVQDVVTEHDFYRSAHQRIFRAMCRLAERGDAIDNVTLTDELRAAGELESVGGAAYLAELVQGVPTAANALAHARIVREKAQRRIVIQQATNLLTEAYDLDRSWPEVLEQTEQAVFRLANGLHPGGFRPIASVLQVGTEYVDRVHQRNAEVTGVPTGFLALDGLTAGWQASDLIVIAGRPSMGKTALALGMGLHAALTHGKVVGMFSLEMSEAQLALRMISHVSHLDVHTLKTGKLDGDGWRRFSEAIARLEAMRFFVDETGVLSVAQLRGRARRLKAEHGLDLLIVDYLQLMQGRPGAESRQQEVSEISRGLKLLAKELNVPVIALSQLSRACEARADKRPFLSDLRDSGGIEQDADVVLFIYRDVVYYPDTPDKTVAEILVRKHRNGPIGEKNLVFLEQYAKFADIAPQAVNAE